MHIFMCAGVCVCGCICVYVFLSVSVCLFTLASWKTGKKTDIMKRNKYKKNEVFHRMDLFINFKRQS